MNYRILCLGTLVVSMTGCGAGQNTKNSPGVATNQAATRALTNIVASNQPEVALFKGKLDNYVITKTTQGYQVVDKVGLDGTTDIQNAKRLQFSDYSVALDPTGTAAQVYRLYQAAFNRLPDLPGLGFHISTVDGSGISLLQVAQNFINSAEFQEKYGNTDNALFLTLLYNNVLHRAPDSGGAAYWKALLDSGSITRAQALQSFSESAENVAAVAPRIMNGIVYSAYPVASAGVAWEQSGGKLTWGRNRRLGMLLQDSRGIEVPTGHLSCMSSDEQGLFVAHDCSNAVGRTLGEYNIAVSGDGVNASLTLKVIPPKKSLETSGMSHSGGDFSAVVTGVGNLLAWGSNDNRVLGQGIESSRLPYSSLPLLVKDRSGNGMLSNVVAASTGSNTVLALTENGTVLTWGSASALPKNVLNPSGTAELTHIVQVSVGGVDNATALTDAGTVLSWGYYTGQGTDARKLFPDYVLDPDAKKPLSEIVAVSTGNDFALALGSNGKVYSWGGKVTVPHIIKRASDGAELTGIVAISAGYNFSLALTSDGQIYAWGENAWGQIGQNVLYGNYPQAVIVKGIDALGTLNGIVAVSAGYSHALALDSKGNVLSWGNVTNGMLGEGANGAYKSRYVPGYVVGPDSTGKLGGIVAISAGAEHSMALSNDGTVYMWGAGYAGALGQGGTATFDRHFPVPLKNVTGSDILNLSPIIISNPTEQRNH